MAKMKLLPVGTGLEVERAITARERRRILDAADFLAVDGSKSRDRNRFKGKDRPQRKNFRGYRNRAIVYVLIETGMRRAAVTKIDIDDVNFNRRIRLARRVKIFYANLKQLKQSVFPMRAPLIV